MTQKNRLIHGNLRLWSDDIALTSIVASAGWKFEHLHLRGDIIGAQGRRAIKHYAAMETSIFSNDEELSTWLNAIAEDIHQQKYLISQLTSRKIEGVIWFALFGDNEQIFPVLDRSTIEKLAEDKIDVLTENYTDFDDVGHPRKIWIIRNTVHDTVMES